MKKTLTVNLGGIVFHIDEDAYRLLDNYLCNLKLHFSKEDGAEEIVDDIERRISELFAEKITDGLQVITVIEVEEVIDRMGKPEEMENEAGAAEASDARTDASAAVHSPTRKLFRNPDDKMLGGVASGVALYFGWSVVMLRLALVVCLIFGSKVLLPAYIICWIVIPEAKTAAERLSMRGEAVTVENIGKTVTDGFDRMADGVNSYVHSGKPRSFLSTAGSSLVNAVGWLLKIGLVVIAILCSPVLFIFALVILALIFAAIAIVLDGGAILFSLFPMADVVLPDAPLTAIFTYMAGVLSIGIPLVAVVYSVFASLFHWQPMASGLKWSLALLWIIAFISFFFSFYMYHGQLPDLLIHQHCLSY